MKYELIVVGAGGTGTYFLKEISRYLCNRKCDIARLCIYDGDVVEEKNLTRQCFVQEDIGRNKAAVMAEILADTFGLEVAAYDQYITDVKQIKVSRGYVPIIVGCVDNHGCRLILEEFFEKSKQCILFDSGNEYDTGEVVFAYKNNGIVFGPPRSYYFPDIKKGDVRNVTQMSCEELNRVAPQHIFTNMLAGNLLCCGIANLLSEKITPGVAFFNALSYQVDFVPQRTKEAREGSSQKAQKEGDKHKKDSTEKGKW